ncbi:hypothetical protein CRG98_037200 [Punica granatum]|uniref:Uncharacterized protein n=1 Tax=Punica granatum TaxID=22663 RepID=A0A2I0IEJ0_PUNGR|nr:hypothetical protein CRG98_037200 [Punica granatum]
MGMRRNTTQGEEEKIGSYLREFGDRPNRTPCGPSDAQSYLPHPLVPPSRRSEARIAARSAITAVPGNPDRPRLTGLGPFTFLRRSSPFRPNTLQSGPALFRAVSSLGWAVQSDPV